MSRADIPGINTCLNLETGLRDALFGNPYLEDEALEGDGVRVDHVPFSDIRPPSIEKLEEALHIITTAPGPVYVHCLHGVDRTGMVIAYYRVKRQKWTPEKAIEEMLDLGFHRFPYALIWLPELRAILNRVLG